MPLPDGLHTYLSVKFPVLDDDGPLVAMGGISTDISEHKRVEAALRELGFDIHLTIRTASIHRGHTEAGVEAFVDVAMLEDEGITLEAWDILDDLERLGIPEEQREALQADAQAVARLRRRVDQVRRVLEAISVLRAGQAAT